MDNLWKPIIEDSNSISGPMKTLHEQMNYFNNEDVFYGKLKCKIESSTELILHSTFKFIKQDKKNILKTRYFESNLCISTGLKLNYYNINLIRIASLNVSMLPCEITNCVVEELPVLCNTEEEFENQLRIILQSDSIKKVISNLLVMCN